MHCEVAFVTMFVGLQVTCTELIVGELDCAVIVTDAVLDFAMSWVLVAVTVAVAAEEGAVKIPLELTAPPVAAHVTVEA